MTQPNWTHELHRDDLAIKADDWVAQYRATVAGQGGGSTVTLAEQLAARLRSALTWDVADGVVVFRDERAANRQWRALSAEALQHWASWALGQDERHPLDVWREVADRVRAHVLADQAERLASVPAYVREAEEARARQRAADRLAELDAEDERRAAERAALEGGQVPPEPQEPPRERPDGGWLFRRR